MTQSAKFYSLYEIDASDLYIGLFGTDYHKQLFDDRSFDLKLTAREINKGIQGIT
jgi:hypothetical protein